MQIGLLIEGQEGVTRERWLRVIELAERLGFETLWLSILLFRSLELQNETLLPCGLPSLRSR